MMAFDRTLEMMKISILLCLQERRQWGNGEKRRQEFEDKQMYICFKI
jgi:hypothetical protein